MAVMTGCVRSRLGVSAEMVERFRPIRFAFEDNGLSAIDAISEGRAVSTRRS